MKKKSPSRLSNLLFILRAAPRRARKAPPSQAGLRRAPSHTLAITMAATSSRLPCAPRPGTLPRELESALTPDETASTLLARSAADPLPSGLPLVGCLRPGEVLEFVGPSGVGKTALLVQV